MATEKRKKELIEEIENIGMEIKHRLSKLNHDTCKVCKEDNIMTDDETLKQFLSDTHYDQLECEECYERWPPLRDIYSLLKSHKHDNFKLIYSFSVKEAEDQ